MSFTKQETKKLYKFCTTRKGEALQALHNKGKKNSMNFAQQGTSIESSESKTRKSSQALHNEKQQ
jgi:hypothetical protein